MENKTENMAGNIFSYWSLNDGNRELKPLKFSNGKTQEDVVKEIVDAIKGNGKDKEKQKIVFLHGMCGTGKSAIALNVARVLGRSAVAVPFKGLQRQYKEDYTEKLSVDGKDGKKLKISVITGRDNHDSAFWPGVSCADPMLPENIKMTDRNFVKIKEYYEQNPHIGNKEIPDVREMTRVAVAPANPYWSPIVAEDVYMPLKDAKKKKYRGLNGRDFIFYQRKTGCSYYDQYQGYWDSDLIIFNAAKYKIEVALDRKPETEIDIIDEADEFLDSFSNQIDLNLSKLFNSLSSMHFDNLDVQGTMELIKKLIRGEETNKMELGLDTKKIYKIEETNMKKILSLFLKHPEFEVEISLDELNYANKAIEAAKEFEEFFDETYLTYSKHEDNLYAHLVTVNLSRKLGDVLDKNKNFLFMSGTLHSDVILKNIFGINSYKVIEAENNYQGEMEIVRTGKEFDCSYKNFISGGFDREQYLRALEACVDKAKRPTLVHVNSFEDLPTKAELDKFGIGGLISREELIDTQTKDKTGVMISDFKRKKINILYSTKCSRGVDFPGDVCNSVVFTKYPNPNVQGSFWKILEKTHPKYYWDFYKDKAQREFLQRLYRALRSKDDYVYVLSPDSRVLEATRKLQMSKTKLN